MNLTTYVISDVICSWCYIGKRRLEKAVAGLGEPVCIHRRPFQFKPTMPPKLGNHSFDREEN